MVQPTAIQGTLFVRRPRRSWKKKWCEIRGEEFIMNSVEVKKITDRFSVGQISSIENTEDSIINEDLKKSVPSFTFLVTFVDNVSRLYFGTHSKNTLNQWMEALRNSQKYYYNQYRIRKKMETSLNWMKLWVDIDNKPCKRYYHTLTRPLVCVPRKLGFLRNSASKWKKRACSMWMFGGKTENKEYLNDLWELHFPNVEENDAFWNYIKAEGVPPTPRYGHSVVVYGKYIIIFGGRSKTGLCNDLHSFHTETFLWTRPMYEGRAPAARYHHTATVIGNKMFIIGGKSNKTVYEDIFYLNLDLLKWEQVDIRKSTVSPGPLYCHTSTLVKSSLLFVYGGRDNKKTINDTLWFFDLNLMLWTQPSSRGSIPKGRMSHVSSLVGKNMFISGGKSNTEYFDDIFYLCTETLVWYYSTISGIDKPGPRYGHVASEINDTQYSYGGKIQEQDISNDIFALATKSLEKQWYDSISYHNYLSCIVCEKEISESSLYVQFISSKVAFHQSCLQDKLSQCNIDSNIDIRTIISNNKKKTDLNVLLDFVRNIFITSTHPLYVNLVKFSREFNAEYKTIQPDTINLTIKKAIEEVTVYLDYFNSMVIKNIQLLDSIEGREQCYIIIKSTLLPMIYDVMLKLFKYEKEDNTFSKYINLYKDKTIADFKLNPDFILLSNDNDPYQIAIDIAKTVSKSKDPFTKVDSLVLMRHSIHLCIDNYYKHMNKKVFLAADDLVTLYQYVLLKAEVKYIKSELQYIRNFLGDSFNNGEIDYCLTTLEVSVDGIHLK